MARDFDVMALPTVTLRQLGELVDPDTEWEAFNGDVSLDVVDETEAAPIIARLTAAGFQEMHSWITRVYGSQSVRSCQWVSLNARVNFVIAPHRRA
jgi:hypothetical protein